MHNNLLEKKINSYLQIKNRIYSPTKSIHFLFLQNLVLTTFTYDLKPSK